MIIFDCEQRTPEWFAARSGVFSASEFGPFIIKSDATSTKARRKLLLAKICEGKPKDAWQLQLEADEERRMRYNVPVQRGNALEEEARDWFAERMDLETAQVGFITHAAGGFGCSPDALLTLPNSDEWIGGLEIKCPMPEKHLDYLLAGTLPEEYKFQIHGSMAVTGLDFWYFLSYCPGEAPLLLKIERDAFTESLLAGLHAITAEKREIEARLATLWEQAFGDSAGEAA